LLNACRCVVLQGTRIERLVLPGSIKKGPNVRGRAFWVTLNMSTLTDLFKETPADGSWGATSGCIAEVVGWLLVPRSRPQCSSGTNSLLAIRQRHPIKAGRQIYRGGLSCLGPIGSGLTLWLGTVRFNTENHAHRNLETCPAARINNCKYMVDQWYLAQD